MPLVPVGSRDQPPIMCRSSATALLLLPGTGNSPRIDINVKRSILWKFIFNTISYTLASHSQVPRHSFWLPQTGLELLAIRPPRSPRPARLQTDNCQLPDPGHYQSPTNQANEPSSDTHTTEPASQSCPDSSTAIEMTMSIKRRSPNSQVQVQPSISPYHASFLKFRIGYSPMT